MQDALHADRAEHRAREPSAAPAADHQQVGSVRAANQGGGRRATDGPWAPHWYQAVEASTGFGPPEREKLAGDLSAEARRLADRCRPYYDRLARHRITG